MIPESKSNVRIAFVGDVALAGEFVKAAQPSGAPLIFPFSPLTSLLEGVDVLVVNLEGPLSREGEPRKGRTSLIHNQPEVLDWFKKFPVCVCNLANNHMLDYGPETLQQTQDQLTQAGIPFVGAGRNEVQANEPAVITVRGWKLAFLNYTTNAPHVGSVLAGPDSPGCASFTAEANVLAAVERAARQVDTLVVSPHWGHEFYRYPTPDQTLFARRLVDAGATLVVGHHPHVQQGFEEYKDGLIAYSLGNLLLPEMRMTDGRLQYRKPATKQFAILQAEIAGRRIERWQLNGGRCSQRYALDPYTEAGRKKFDADMLTLSAPLSAPDYPAFWAGYQPARTAELRREAVRDALAKVLRTDWPTLLGTLSMKDLSRNVQRIIGLLSSR